MLSIAKSAVANRLRYCALLLILVTGCATVLWHVDFSRATQARDFYLQGFYPSEGTPGSSYRFSRAHASVLIPNRATDAAQLTLRIRSPKPLPTRTLVLSMQQSPLAEITVGDLAQTIMIALPDTANTPAGAVLVALDTAGARAPGDPRDLGLLFDSIVTSSISQRGVRWDGRVLLLIGSGILIGACLIVARRWRAGSPGPAGRSADFWLLTGICALYTYVLSFYSIANHLLFRTNTYDLGVFDQAIWLISQGQPAYISGGGMHILSDHAAFILYALAGLYALVPDTRALLIAQSLIIALGAVPVYLLGRARGSRLAGGVAALAYLLHPATLNMNLFDFHPDSIAATAFLWTCWATTQRHWRVALLSSLCVLACKENFALTIAWLGIWLIVHRTWRFGSVLLALGGAWFLVATLIVGPAFSSGVGSHVVGRFAQYGSSLPEIVQTLVLHPRIVLSALFQPEQRAYLWALLLPFGLLPLLSPRYLVLAAPAVVLNLLSNFSAQHSTLYHYNALIIPCLALALLHGLLTLQAGTVRLFGTQHKVVNRMWFQYLILLCAIAYGLITQAVRIREIHGAMASAGAQPYYYEYVLSLIPSHAGVSAQTQLQPHLNHRLQAFLFPNPFKPVVFYDPRGQPFPTDVEYVVYDRRHSDNAYIRSSAKLAVLDDLQRRQLFYVVVDLDGVLLLKRNTA